MRALRLTLLVLVAAAARAADDGFDATIKPILAQYCLGCHSTEKQKGDLDLEAVANRAGVRRHPRIWQRVAEQVGGGEMPPDNKPQPTPEQRAALMAWLKGTLATLARERAGDPGPVVLRRLSNAEYTATIRDLTGVPTLDPAREFPVDGAAGEGFSNTGMALAMSPALMGKFLDAAKDLATHAVLLPDGLRFAAGTTRREWSSGIIADIRAFYARYTESAGSDRYEAQGIQFDRTRGGRLPLERYLAAACAARDAGAAADLAALARDRGLSAKYLRTLLAALRDQSPSPLLDDLRARWKTMRAEDAPAVVGEIARWQGALWRFESAGGQLELDDAKKHWQTPASPLAPSRELRVRLPDHPDGPEVVVTLSSTALAGGAGAEVAWTGARLQLPGQPPMPLREAAAAIARWQAARTRLVGCAAKALAAADELRAAATPIARDELARRHGLPTDALTAWLAVLGLGDDPAPVPELMAERSEGSAEHPAVRGWNASGGRGGLWTNASDAELRMPGLMRAHALTVHPSPTHEVVVAWRSPIDGVVAISGAVRDADTACGNGVLWLLERRHGTCRERLADGIVQNDPAATLAVDAITVRTGETIELTIDPRDGDHGCDLTELELSIAPAGASGRSWSLARDIVEQPLAGNPHPDHDGTPDVWSFSVRPVAAASDQSVIPRASLLGQWLDENDAAKRHDIAERLQRLLSGPLPADAKDLAQYRQLTSVNGPLCAHAAPAHADALTPASAPATRWALPPQAFGHRRDGTAVDADALCAPVGERVAVRLPSDLVAGGELIAVGAIDPAHGADAAVALQATVGDAPPAPRQLWQADPGAIAVLDGSAARARLDAAFDAFRALFPAAACYTQIVPTDEVITLTLTFRDDAQLARLALEPDECARLDRLWDELRFVSQEPLAQIDAFEQVNQFTTQGGGPASLEHLRKPISTRADAFRARLRASEPAQLDAAVALAERAWRRPFAPGERESLRALYATLRTQDVPHDQAIRLLIARELSAAPFLYRLERAPAGAKPAPVGAWELATRLSYFLWSSLPDDELRAVATSGELLKPAVLAAQARRLLRDDRVRRLATEFGCGWLQIHGLDALDEKSEKVFPQFRAIRGGLYEEAIRAFADFFHEDRAVASLIDGDRACVDGALAAYYGIPGVDGAQWRVIDGARTYGRGGVLGLGAALAQHAGASRTSPILRGIWVSETLLGERLPRPPKDVPRLPEDEPTDGLTVRQITERHTSDARCMRCHARTDPFGYALEGYDAIGRARDRDAGGRPIDAATTLPDGTKLVGIDGLRAYLLGPRRAAFERQFCRKLLGYALGRAVRLSDEPLLDDIAAALSAHDDRVGAAIETIVQSRQFREIRGRDAATDDD